MKKILKTIVPDAQRRKIRDARAAWGKSFKNFRANVVNHLLPDRMKVDLKESIRVIRKLDYDKREIMLNVDSDIEFLTRLHSCKKEPEMISWIENTIKPGDVLYDIGANVGAYSLVAAKYHDGKVKVFSFEPSFLNFVQLSKNIFTNNLDEVITPMQVALSDETTLGMFHYSNLTPGGALHAFGQAVDYKGDVFKAVYQQQVFSYRLDDLIERFKLPPPQHIKIDVDGIEFKILQGAKQTLGHPKFKSIILELDEGDDESKKMMNFLNGLGLKYLSKHKYTSEEDQGPFSRMYNYIFARS